MMFCPENGELALLRRVRQKSAAPCRMRLSGRREARPSPAAEMQGGRFFVSILKMNFIVNIGTGLFSPSRPRCSKAHDTERFTFAKATCGAAQCRPAQSERKNTLFRETTGRMAGRTKHFKQNMLSTKSAPCRPASSPAPGGFAAWKDHFRKKAFSGSFLHNAKHVPRVQRTCVTARAAFAHGVSLFSA